MLGFCLLSIPNSGRGDHTNGHRDWMRGYHEYQNREHKFWHSEY